jgi:hypothetical protein
MPADADAHTYLKIASMAIKHHDKATADEALNRAETRMLTRSVVASGPMTDDSPGVTAVENARQAVDAGNFHEAMMDTDMAMHHHMAGGNKMSTNASDNSDSSDWNGTPSPHAQENGNNGSSASSIPGDGTSSPGMSAGASSGSQQ